MKIKKHTEWEGVSKLLACTVRAVSDGEACRWWITAITTSPFGGRIKSQSYLLRRWLKGGRVLSNAICCLMLFWLACRERVIGFIQMRKQTIISVGAEPAGCGESENDFSNCRGLLLCCFFFFFFFKWRWLLVQSHYWRLNEGAGYIPVCLTNIHLIKSLIKTLGEFRRQGWSC